MIVTAAPAGALPRRLQYPVFPGVSRFGCELPFMCVSPKHRDCIILRFPYGSITGIPDKKVNRVRITMSDEMRAIPVFGRTGFLAAFIKYDRIIRMPGRYRATRKGDAARGIIS